MLCLLLACEKPVEIAVPPHQSRLVINGQQAQGRLFNVRVGHSIGITEPVSNQNSRMYDVQDAVVILKQNGVVVDTLVYNRTNLRYEGRRHRGVLGSRYSVEATAQGFVMAEGASAFPELVRPETIALRKNARTSSNNEPLDEIKITLNDPPGQTNYYLLRIRDAGGNYAYCVETTDKDVERLVSSDPFATAECLNGSRLMVADRNFSGKTKVLIFYANSNQMEPRVQQGRTIRPTIELLSINEDYFRYMKSINAYDNADDNPFAEPVNVVSNITNGYGFFTTFALAVDTLR